MLSCRSSFLRRPILTIAACAVLCGSSPAFAQPNVWDTTISNTNWYVPVPHLLGYVAPRATLANPVAVGDQTLWSLGVSTNGSFTGTSSARLAIGPALVVSDSTIQGTVTPSGQITMVFTPVGGGTPTVGLGQMRTVGGVTAMEMQMITGETLLVTHWASMLPYDPATFTPPPAQHFVVGNASPQWSWTAGTPWRIVSPAMFGTNAPGRFVITNYQGGYFWGRGIGPNGSSVGVFSLLGSITPEGKVLLNTVSKGDLTSLYGDIAGNPLAAQMLLSEYDLSGNMTGGLASVSLIRPYTEILAQMNNRAALGAAQALYRVATSPDSLIGPDGSIGPMVPVLDALDGLGGGRALSNAVSQTLPVLVGAASQATYNTQRGLQQIVTGRLDSIRGADDLGTERHIWLRPLGGVLQQSGLDGVPGYRASGGGIAAGIDRTVAERLAIGGVFAYSHNSIKTDNDALSQTLAVSSYQLGLYGAYALRPDVDLNFQIDGALNRNNESRSIAFMNSVASAGYDSHTVHAGLGIRKMIATQSGLTFIPSLRVDFAQVHANAYSETGAGPLSLNVDSQTYRELMVTAAVKGIYRITDRIHLTGQAGVGYNTLNNQVQITAAYLGGGGSFVTHGLEVSPWLYSAGAGLVGIASDTLNLSVRYDLNASPTGLLNQMGSVVLKAKI